MNSNLRDVLLSIILIIAVLFYDIKSGNIHLHRDCYRHHCHKDKTPYRDQNPGIEKKYRQNFPLETVYIDFNNNSPKGSFASGTAFVIDKNVLLSARHVIESCRNSYVIDSKNNKIPIIKTEIQDGADVALLYIDKPLSSDFFLVDNVNENSNRDGFHFGFPQSNSGQAYSHFLGQTKLMNSGGYRVNEDVLVWSVEKKSSEVLSGISGGPVFNQDGMLVGVSIGESLRRGRTYSSNPKTNKYIVDTYHVDQDKNAAKKIQVDFQNYENLNKKLQSDNMIVMVICSY